MLQNSASAPYEKPHLFEDMCTPLTQAAFLNVEITLTDIVKTLL
jgi:hypothetical protein